ncbi:MAG: methylmalonyl-CoA mutase [Planctomycetota bacterium]|nr:MAG: methylmalonyl-CoA mutase [Planctomycetota bacterium]
MAERRIRVLIGKPGLDGHDRGAKVVATALRDRGMEVIYSGLHRTPEQLVQAAEQEDVDVIGLSILSGSHMELLPQVRRLLVQRGLEHVVLVGGGIIPPADAAELEKGGYARIFGPGTPTQAIAEFIEEKVGIEA